MSRSNWKPKFFHPQAISNNAFSSGIYLQNRATILTSSMLSKTFYVYNGMSWFKIEVMQERLGHRVGEFVPTRKRPSKKKK